MSELHVIVGLGNPGPKYENTRHNIGWWVIDELVRRYDLGKGRKEKRAQTWSANIRGQGVKLVKPLTFMNRSGEAVRSLLDYFKVPIGRLMVVHDDLDTPFGELRLRQAGGHGGQNGLRSIVQHLGSKDFARLRFGIGRPPGKMDPVDYVLQTLRGDDLILARELTDRAADAVETWLQDGIDKAMSAHNGAGPNRRAQPVNLQEQLEIARRAHELAPDDPKPLSKLISLQKKLGMLDQAVDNHLLLATLLEAEGAARLAVAEKIKAATINPGLVDLQHEIADWYLNHDNKKKAVSRMLIIADYFLGENDVAAARAAVAEALAINPQHPKTLEMQKALAETATENEQN
ncbi:MAG: aminoacyl-tRNA hydrolase [Chloroflexi bacterium]|nr:aminoacyl-tRNA hydrolase [Chloroflexota bacterium]